MTCLQNPGCLGTGWLESRELNSSTLGFLEGEELCWQLIEGLMQLVVDLTAAEQPAGAEEDLTSN